MPSGNSLMEILDGIMLLYHVAAHKQLGKVFLVYIFVSAFSNIKVMFFWVRLFKLHHLEKTLKIVDF